MRMTKLIITLVPVVLGLAHDNVFAASQSVSTSVSAQEIAEGDQVTVSVTYQATDDSLTTGLGLRLHFDSSKLSG